MRLFFRNRASTGLGESQFKKLVQEFILIYEEFLGETITDRINIPFKKPKRKSKKDPENHVSFTSYHLFSFVYHLSFLLIQLLCIHRKWRIYNAAIVRNNSG